MYVLLAFLPIFLCLLTIGKKKAGVYFLPADYLLAASWVAWCFSNPHPVAISQETSDYFSSLGITQQTGLMPVQLYNSQALLSLKGFSLMIVGGFLVGFGPRYAQGCTSGHGILGLSALQWPSLLATASFFIGGILFSRFVLPYILTL